MILSIFLYFLGLMISIFSYVLSGINWVIPDFITDSIAYAVNLLHVFDWILPMDNIMACVYVLITCFGVFVIIYFLIMAINTAKPSGHTDIKPNFK